MRFRSVADKAVEKTSRTFLIGVLAAVVLFGVCGGIYGLFASGLLAREQMSPYDFPGSTWESADPEVHLYVVNTNIDSAQAYIVVDGEEITVKIIIDSQGKVGISERVSGRNLLSGRERFSTDKAVISVYTDSIFNGAYSKITLYRTDTQQDQQAG